MPETFRIFSREGKLRRPFLLLPVFMAIFLLWPVTTLQNPPWEVQVADSSGHALGNIAVRLSYQNYSAESESHEVDAQTDQNGYAHFQPHYLTASRVQRLAMTMSSAMAGVHASFGPHAGVFAFGQGLEGGAVENGIIVDWTGSPARMNTPIIMRRMP